MWWQQVSSLTEWAFTICLMPYKIVFSALLNKKILTLLRFLQELFSLLIDDELSTPRGGASATSLL